MKRIKGLSIFQKIVLLILIIMVIVFSIIYPITISRKGYVYNDALLIPSEADGSTVYSGKIQGVPASFTVTPDKVVEFRYGDKSYGPYYYKEDPSAVAENISASFPGADFIGFELYCKDEMIFRGCKAVFGSNFLLFDENGNRSLDIKLVPGYGTIATDKNGKEIDPMEPSVTDILVLMDGPELTNKGNGFAWFAGVFICIISALSILFVDELFRWQIGFRVANPDNVEPADWEIISRYLAWTLMPIVALVFFIIGLK